VRDDLVPDRVTWKGTSSVHDWSDGRLFSSLVERAGDLGLIGPTTWAQIGWEGDPEVYRIESPERLIPSLLSSVALGDEMAFWKAGGEDPRPWSLTLAVCPFDERVQAVRGLNVISLSFDRSLVATPRRSCELADAFTKVHSPDNTEYAFVHPADHFDRIDREHYEVPVTVGPMFRGVWWANFLGPGHLDQFDRDELAALRAYRIEWVDGRGLFLLATPDINRVEEPPAEAELLRLTELFRAALREDSKWYS
jgi:hypothetical protein